MINIKELYEQYLDEGYSFPLAVQMAKEEVDRRFKQNKKAAVAYDKERREITAEHWCQYVSQPLPLCHVSVLHQEKIRIRKKQT